MPATLRPDNKERGYQTYDNIGFEGCQTIPNSNRDSIYEISEDYEGASKASNNCCEKCVVKIQSNISGFYKKKSSEFKLFLQVVLLILYFVYFGYALYYNFGDEESIRLLTCTSIGLFLIILKVSGQLITRRIKKTPECFTRIASNIRLRLFVRW
ncbi:hypothetical protein KUTeg_002097 [Tegillarca granosa]|uniref:Uncharacterized protein n=1 Tax=Tegillarca granosa TaxID=220873 RepID=A0ABQ9FTG1_TEGGR|nr:hypothetical protein KUTeg_002097 [Tegillarca granosa]